MKSFDTSERGGAPLRRTIYNVVCDTQGVLLRHREHGAFHRLRHGRRTTFGQVVLAGSSWQLAISLHRGFHAMFLHMEPGTGKAGNDTGIELYVYAAAGIAGLLGLDIERTGDADSGVGYSVYPAGYLYSTEEKEIGQLNVHCR